MKKRVLSLFLAAALCFSTLPMTAFAQEADVTAENFTEDPAADGDVSGGNAAVQDAEKDAAVKAVQALIDALPEEVTAENAEDIGAQLAAIDEALENLAALDETLASALNMERYNAICAALTTFVAVQDSGHTHYLCGEEHQEVGDHTTDSLVTFTKLWMDDDGTLKIGDDALETTSADSVAFRGTCYELPTGDYYLDSDITLKYPLYIPEADSGNKLVNLCLNGCTITADGDFAAVILYSTGRDVTFSLTDCKDTGKITHSENATGNGVYVYSSNAATFNMYGGTITGNNATNGGVFVGGNDNYLHNVGSIFHMYGGSITGNTASINGGGVYVNDCADNQVCIYDGIITDNIAHYSGGGVYAYNGVFNISGGTITGNTADGYGGGVRVGDKCYVNMSGTVKITGNKRGNNENNFYLSDNQIITVQSELTDGASIGVTTSKGPSEGSFVRIAVGSADYNLSDTDKERFFLDAGNAGIMERAGSTILIKKEGDTTLHDHPVCGATCNHTAIHENEVWVGISDLNQIQSDGCYYLTAPVTLTDQWYCKYNVKLCLNGQTITGASGQDDIYIPSQSYISLDITDCQEPAGKITHNPGENGRGVHVGQYCNFTMWNGNITGNQSNLLGSGVSLEAYCNFTMNGGTITGNNDIVVGIGSRSGSVYGNPYSTITVSGTVRIEDNWMNGTLDNGVYVKGANGQEDNVYLKGNYSPYATITIGEGLTEDSRIGVNKSDSDFTGGKVIKIATGATGTVDYTKIFTLDESKTTYLLTMDTEGNLYMGPHQHNWIYTLNGDGKTITATCINTVGCSDSNGGSVTIKAPDENTLTYDGSAKAAVIESNDWQALSVYDITISYRDANNNETINAPTSAGDYTASITLTGADGKSATASVKYTIQKAELAESDFTFTAPGDLVYNGSDKKAYFYSRKVNTQLITAKYYDESGAEVSPQNVGTYTVRINVRESANYNAVNGLTANSWKFTITKAQGGSLTAYNFGQKFSNLTERSCTPDYSSLPAGQNWKYSISNATVTGSASVASYNMDPVTGKLTYKLAGGEIGDTVRWTVTISSNNYTDFTQELILTLSDKEDQEPLIIVGDSTVVYGQTLKLTTTGGSGTGAVTYWVDPNLGTGTATIDAEGVLTPGKIGTVAVRAFKAGDDDYNAAMSARLVVTITKAMPTGEPGYTEITSDGKTLADAGLTLTNSTLNPGEGTLEWIDDEGNALKEDTRVEVNKTYRWRFTPVDDNYDTLTGGIELYHVDAPAISAQPEDITIQPGEKAVFEVKAAGTDLKYQWMIDRNDGKGFVAITGADGASYSSGVTDLNCNGYRYYCVISNIIGSVTTNTVTLTVSNNTDPKPTATPKPGTDSDPYRIIDGANSSWTQNTDGTLTIRGNGEFAKFVNVKVDGQIVDPGNYTAAEGSTIITLKTEYLKTLSEGSHTFEIVWTDGTASTGFTVAANTPGDDDDDDDGDSNNNTDNSNNTGNNSNIVPAQVTAPETGDTSGYWILLFVISCAGLAGMLVRRKR